MTSREQRERRGERTRRRRREDGAREKRKPVFSEWNIEQFSVA